MADDKTTKVYARLTRDFPAGVSHRRGGLTLASGPAPVVAEVTDEQLAALKADPKVQLMDDAEGEKLIERFATEPDHPSAAEIETADGDADGDRDYGDGDGDDGDEGDEPETPPTAEELADKNNRDVLVTMANDAGVEGLNYDDKQVTTKAVIAQAIVAKRDASTDEE